MTSVGPADRCGQDAQAALNSRWSPTRGFVQLHEGWMRKPVGKYSDSEPTITPAWDPGHLATQSWYENALAVGPDHVRMWQYYGTWDVEQGNMLKARDFLEEIRFDLRRHRVPGICRPEGRDRRQHQLL